MLRTVIQPRVSETDGAGHINNTTIPIWFEAGRDKIFEMFTPSLSFKDWRCIIIHTSVDYMNQIYYGKEVEVKTWVKKIGTTSFALHEELYQEEALCARGTAVYVNFNLDKQEKEVIPDDVRTQLEAHLLNGKEVQT